MALPATETFTNSNGVQLTTHSASWTLNQGDLQIWSNALAPDFPGYGMAHWNADSFNNDQYSEATLVALAGGMIGVAARCAASAYTSYEAEIWPGEGCELIRYVAGSRTTLDNDGYEPSISEVLRIETEGTTITGFLDEVQVLQDTDSSTGSGSAGVCGYGTVTTIRIDDWEAGNLGAGISIPVVMWHLGQQGIS